MMLRGQKNVGNFRHFKNEFLCTQRPCKAEKFPNAGVKFCIASLDSLKLLYKKIVKTFRFDRFFFFCFLFQSLAFVARELLALVFVEVACSWYKSRCSVISPDYPAVCCL